MDSPSNVLDLNGVLKAKKWQLITKKIAKLRIISNPTERV